MNYKMGNLKDFAIKEFEILRKTTPDALVLEFEKEILKLVDKFGKSGQSGFSAPYYSSAITNTLKSLLDFKPITDVTGDESEWNDVKNGMFQNKRISALFYDDSKENSVPYYLNAVVFQGEEQHYAFTSGHGVYIDTEFKENVSSFWHIKGFPFKPKTFYIDVVKVPITEEEAVLRNIDYTKDPNDGTFYIDVLKDKEQLKEVYEYYSEPYKRS